MAQETKLITNVQEWLCDMALFDALIGNTDCHQENWGFVFRFGEKPQDTVFRVRTSLGMILDCFSRAAKPNLMDEMSK